jgi:hypothetical protein
MNLSGVRSAPIVTSDRGALVFGLAVSQRRITGAEWLAEWERLAIDAAIDAADTVGVPPPTGAAGALFPADVDRRAGFRRTTALREPVVGATTEADGASGERPMTLPMRSARRSSGLSSMSSKNRGAGEGAATW